MPFSPDVLFRISSTTALLAWLALLLSPPRARHTPWIWRITGRLLPLLFSLLYVVLLIAYRASEGGFGSIAQVQKLFAVPGLLLAGWIHYLAFDLFVGTWIAQRAFALQLAHWQVVPILLLTFMFGPAGLLAFVALRALRQPGSLVVQPGASACGPGPDFHPPCWPAPQPRLHWPALPRWHLGTRPS